MSDKKLLKNCPFCGGKATIEHDYDFASHPWYYVECDECGCKTESYVDENGKLKAIESWNTRVPMESIVKELEELYMDAQIEYSEAKYHLNEMDSKDSGYISQNYRKDMNEGMCFAFDEAIEIVKEEGGLND